MESVEVTAEESRPAPDPSGASATEVKSPSAPLVVPLGVIEAMKRADAAVRAKRFGEAAGICTDVLAELPDYPPALALLGVLLAHRGEVASAIVVLERAIRQNGSVAVWYSNLAALYRVACRVDECLAAARAAVKLAPENPGFLISLGNAHVDRGESDDAVNCFLAALGRDQENAAAHLALAQVLLARGDFAPGWKEYEWRNKVEQAKGMLPKMVAAPWNGMPLPKSRILLVADQGFGDSLQFCRYIPRVAECAGEVVLGCSADLAPLLSKIPGVSATYHRWPDIPPHTVYCLLSSLPLLFDTGAASIPAEVPYLRAEPGRMAAWAQRLDEALPKDVLRVGFTWSGRPTHPNNRRRSLHLLQLTPIAKLSPVAFLPLQPKISEADTKILAGFPNVFDFTAELSDFGETAALIMNIDLVISIDSSVAHLTGSLGRPVWMMLPRPGDWRWQTERQDSPWYPSMRIFRQPRPGAWEPVITEVAEALAARAATGMPPR